MILEVYKITNKQNGKIYIGITNQGVAVRWCKHCSDARHDSNFPIHNAIRKYGEVNFQIEQIEVVEDVEVLKEREIYWIKEYNSYNRDKGYNLTLGGDGTFGRFHSKETKDKIRQKALNRHPSKETRRQMSLGHQKHVYTKKELKIRSNNGIKTRKAVLQYLSDMTFVKEHESITKAALEVGTDRRNISSCLNSKNPNHIRSAGFIWKYKQ
jgi:group I intron endonuclease